MAMDNNQTHRPGPFKQVNKEHKHGKHRSKSSISKDGKGKISVKAITRKSKGDLSRNQRRHQSAQIRKNKRDEVLAKKRCLGGLNFAPLFVTVVPLNREFDPTSAVLILTQCDEETVVTTSSTGVIHVCVPRFKKRMSFVIPARDNEFDILDSLKVADTVLFLLSAVGGLESCEEIVDKWGARILASSFSQGLPTPVIALTDLESIAPKKRNEFKQQVQSIISKWLPDEKLMLLDKNADAVNLLRRIGNQKRKRVFYRDRRPYLYGEHIEYVPDEKGTMGTLKVTGYLRGITLSVNQLVHIPGLGDFQMSKIEATPDPHKVYKEKEKHGDSGTAVQTLEIANPHEQESLLSENTEHELDEYLFDPPKEVDEEMAEENGQEIKSKTPRGWSEYQAAWIPDNSAEFVEDGYSDEDYEEHKDEGMEAREEECSDMEYGDQECTNTVAESEVAVNDDKYDKELDLKEEQEALEKMKEAKSHLMFPDEVDTPLDVPARERFKKYVWLKSFRNSSWNANEGQPSDYARIFRFKDFQRVKNNILKAEKDKDGVAPGGYVTVYIQNVSQLMWSTFEKIKSPVIVIGLFPTEHKMSIMNVVLKRTQNYDAPIKSKERLIFQCGFRRFVANPIFSQHTLGHKFKFERFFQPNTTVVGTFYAPIQFSPSPVLCYKEVMGTLVPVATGQLLSCDPNRIILKRTVLSGHPFKIYKHSAVVRFMFFNREDIMHYKGCILRTKMGQEGEIKEPLGTHGHMKCIFKSQLKSQDTVLLSLYKRVFPKWTYEDLVVSCANEMETS